MTIKDIVMYQVRCRPSTIYEIRMCLKVYLGSRKGSLEFTYKVLAVLQKHGDIVKKVERLRVIRRSRQLIDTSQVRYYYHPTSNDLKDESNESQTNNSSTL